MRNVFVVVLVVAPVFLHCDGWLYNIKCGGNTSEDDELLFEKLLSALNC